MAASIQFYGKDAVTTAADNRQCARWAMFDGRQFLFKYEGNDKEESLQMLEKTLDCLQESGTISRYTLKFYEEAVKIKENTPCDGSFNFKLFEEEQIQQRKVMYQANNSELLKRLEAIEEKISGSGDEEPEEEEEDFISGLLKDPTKIEQYMGMIGRLFSGGKAAAAIAGTPAVSTAATTEEGKINEAVNILKQHDSELSKHLLKLAAIAKEKPDAFKYLTQMLDSQ